MTHSLRKLITMTVADHAAELEREATDPTRYGPEPGEEDIVEQPPYPWCKGNPTKQDCIRLGYCGRDPNCGE